MQWCSGHVRGVASFVRWLTGEQDIACQVRQENMKRGRDATPDLRTLCAPSRGENAEDAASPGRRITRTCAMIIQVSYATSGGGHLAMTNGYTLAGECCSARAVRRAEEEEIG